MAAASYYDVGDLLNPTGTYTPFSRHESSTHSHSRPHDHRPRSLSRSRAHLDPQYDDHDHRPRSRSRSHHRLARSEAYFSDDNRSSSNSKSRGPLYSITSRFSRSSLFGGRPSYYKRSPRKGFLHRARKQFRRILRDLIHYARRHPWRVLCLLVVPLLGSLVALLARFGMRVPAALENLLGMASRAADGDPIGAVSDAVRMAGGIGGVYVIR